MHSEINIFQENNENKLKTLNSSQETQKNSIKLFPLLDGVNNNEFKIEVDNLPIKKSAFKFNETESNIVEIDQSKITNHIENSIYPNSNQSSRMFVNIKDQNNFNFRNNNERNYEFSLNNFSMNYNQLNNNHNVTTQIKDFVNFNQRNFTSTSKFTGVSENHRKLENTTLENQFIFENNSELDNTYNNNFSDTKYQENTFKKEFDIINKDLGISIEDKICEYENSLGMEFTETIRKDRNRSSKMIKSGSIKTTENLGFDKKTNEIEVKSSIARNLNRFNFFDNESLGSRNSVKRYECTYDTKEIIDLNLNAPSIEELIIVSPKNLRNSNKIQIKSSIIKTKPSPSSHFIPVKCEEFTVGRIQNELKKSKSFEKQDIGRQKSANSEIRRSILNSIRTEKNTDNPEKKKIRNFSDCKADKVKSKIDGLLKKENNIMNYKIDETDYVYKRKTPVKQKFSHNTNREIVKKEKKVYSYLTQFEKQLNFKTEKAQIQTKIRENTPNSKRQEIKQLTNKKRIPDKIVN